MVAEGSYSKVNSGSEFMAVKVKKGGGVVVPHNHIPQEVILLGGYPTETNPHPAEG